MACRELTWKVWYCQGGMGCEVLLAEKLYRKMQLCKQIASNCFDKKIRLAQRLRSPDEEGRMGT